MRLITRIDIEGFRSVASVKIDPVGSFTCFVGANNSGKSNILRAVSLFFTGEPEPAVPLNFARDYHADPKSKKKKRITVSMGFDLPDAFSFRKGLEPTRDQLGRKFVIRKSWTLAAPEPDTAVAKEGGSFRPLSPSIVKQFTDLITFRYIPNRIIPTLVLKSEAASFQAHMARRLRQKGVDPTPLLTAIRQTASEVLFDSNQRLSSATRSISNLEMGTPLDLAELPHVSGFRARSQTGAPVSDDAWGAGTQAHMMFCLLKLVDTDFGRHFGWREAAVWAVEEPESSLHRDLQQLLAVTLREWSDLARMQVLSTTHNEIFATTATDGFIVVLSGGRTEVRSRSIPELVYQAAATGISGPVEPLLSFPLNPVVLVAGPLDRRILEHVSQKTGVAVGCKFIALRELDPVEHGGDDNLVAYLRRCGWLVQNRAINAPLIVLFDWEVDEQKLVQARRHYGANSDLRVFRMNTAHADSRISRGMAGIERFYPVELFRAAAQANIVDVAIDQHENTSIERDKLVRAKSALANMLCEAPDDTWYQHLRKVLEDVARVASLLPGQQIGGLI